MASEIKNNEAAVEEKDKESVVTATQPMAFLNHLLGFGEASLTNSSSANRNDTLTGVQQQNLSPSVSVLPSSREQECAETSTSAGFVATATASWKGLVDRVQKTYRGSADDIGWLQKMPGVRPVKDRTKRFHDLLGRPMNGIHTLPDSLVYLLIPGLFSNHGPLYFQDTKKHFSKLGLPCHIARIHSESSVEKNAKEVKQYVEELYWGTGKKVIILGHSKGGVDGAAALSLYWDSLKDKVAGLVIIQSPYGGSPIASDLLREGQILDAQTRRLLEMTIKTVIKGDITALDDLVYEKRRNFLTDHPLPDAVPVVSFHSEASRAAAAFTTFTHIAHAELPWAPIKKPELNPTKGSETELDQTGKVPVVVPLPALMALSALNLSIRYGAGAVSDGMVVRTDAEVPGSVVVRPTRKMDHAWMAYSPPWKDPKEVDAPQMCEALITLLLDSFPEIEKNIGVNEGVRELLSEEGEGKRVRENETGGEMEGETGGEMEGETGGEMEGETGGEVERETERGKEEERNSVESESRMAIEHDKVLLGQGKNEGENREPPNSGEM